jgi:pilus assembly protein CpaF
VYRLIRAITMTDASAQISTLDPTLDAEMLDGTRVSILQPPFVRQPVITFRQYPFNTFTFEEEARRCTIDPQAVEWFKQLSRLMLNMIVSGPVRSGKTTLLKVIFGARNPKHTVVTIEREHYEIALSRDFPERAPYLTEGRLSLEDMRSIFPRLLRVDARYIMVPEVRSDEVELLLLSAERGNGYLGSYHSPHVWNIPAELATLSLNAYPNRSYVAEYIRAAQTLDVVITMDKGHGRRKVVTGVYAFEYDDDLRQLNVQPWCLYDPQRDDWLYTAEIPRRLHEKILRQADPEVQETYPTFQASLIQLAQAKPAGDVGKRITKRLEG